MGSLRDEVFEAFAAFDTIVDTLLSLDFDALSPAERIRTDAQLEAARRRLPVVEHRLRALSIWVRGGR